jgi:hypothetical protein
MINLAISLDTYVHLPLHVSSPQTISKTIGTKKLKKRRREGDLRKEKPNPTQVRTQRDNCFISKINQVRLL